MSIKDIFLDLIKEAESGKVIIDSEEWPIAFNTVIRDKNNHIEYVNDNNIVQLEIRDLDKFINVLSEYIDLEKEMNRKTFKIYDNKEYNYIKLLISYLFVNASTEDFIDPVKYINRYINYLKDNTFNELNNSMKFDLTDALDGNELLVKDEMQSVMMETPHKIEISIVEKGNQSLLFKLPEISYGVSNNECYIYSILNKEDKIGTPELEKYKKKISRKLYKVNEGLSEKETKEFRDYKDGITEYYPENITDISVSSVLSLHIFINLLRKKGLDTIKLIPYLPIRYYSRFQSAKESDKKDELLQRNDQIQYNLTNKFIRTLRRIADFDDSIEIVSLPYEYDEFLTCKLKKVKKNDNRLLDEVSKSIRSK